MAWWPAEEDSVLPGTLMATMWEDLFNNFCVTGHTHPLVLECILIRTKLEMDAGEPVTGLTLFFFNHGNMLAKSKM